ncbi:MAG: glycosyltransferase family 39 protein [Candidatus Bathyarchaeota archaeon]|nr:glycosyltransferase family 39 protein [Candidatus Bathyarchaeota archaeon]
MVNLNSKLLSAAIIAAALSVILYVIGLRNPMQDQPATVPFDAGWLGILFILANGFLLSISLNHTKIGAAERAIMTVGLGFGLTFLATICLGVLWEITFLSVLSTQLALFIALSITAYVGGYRPKIAFRPSNLKPAKINNQHLLLLAIISVLIVASTYSALALPATEWDSLAYGVNYARLIFQNSHIPLIAGPSIGIEMSAAYPPGMQLTAASLYTLAGSANDFYYRLLSPIFSLTILLVTYKFAMQFTANRTYSFLAVAALALVPFFWMLFIEETYLMALTLMMTLCAYFFFRAQTAGPGEAKKYEASGVLFGAFAALTSYIGLAAIGIFLIYALHKKISLKQAAPLAALGLAIIFPWYLRNLLLLGNPLYPFFGIGKYLDPLLLSSTTQHFQHYALDPLYHWTTTLYKAGAVLLVAGTAIFTFYRPRRNLRVALPLYLLLVSVAVMAFHVAFPRYLIIALPALAVLFAYGFTNIPNRFKLPKIIPAAFFVLAVVLLGAVMLPYANTVKPLVQPGETKVAYLSHVFEEGDAWQWINQNTPANTRIATFDIKGYYLNRSILPLDGNESAPLYHMSGIEEALAFLEGRGVGYVLSVPWAGPTDIRMPPAYDLCILTKYLGTASFLPLVFVGANGTSVYHVGPVDTQTITEDFARRGLVYPLRQFSVNVTVTDSCYPYKGEFYLPIPVEYRGLNITASAFSSHPIELHLWTGLIDTYVVDNPYNFMVANSEYGLAGNSTASFNWGIDKAGYFTIRVVDKASSFQTPFNVTVNVEFIEGPAKAT